MTTKKALKIFNETGNLRDFLINTMDAYKHQLAASKGCSDTKFNHMNHAIVGCKMIVNDCFREFDKRELEGLAIKKGE